MEVVLGIDLGTTYFKLGLFDRAGRLRGLGRTAVDPDRGDGSRCELPTERFWAQLREGLREALDQAGAEPADVRAVSYASQANSFLLLDDADRPLTPFVLWPDAREEPLDPAIAGLWEREDFLATTGLGLPCSPRYQVAKLAGLRRRDDIWSRARRIMTVSDYLVFSLTGRAVGDEATASLLGMWKLAEHDWWDEALDAIGVRRSQLSGPLRPGTTAGTVTADGADRLGLRAGIPLAVGSLDHHAAALGAGAGAAVRLSESTGTVLACLALLDAYDPRAGCCVGPGAGEAPFYRLAFNDNGAGVLQWYRREHAPAMTTEELVALAEGVPPGCDGLMALPEAHSYPRLDGFLGCSCEPGPGHYVRAILESTAASLADLMDLACPTGKAERILATGGGARSDLWLQIKADMTGAEFLASDCPEPAARGAGLFAAVAAGWFEAPGPARAAWHVPGRTFQPRPDEHGYYLEFRKRRLAVTDRASQAGP